MSTARFINAAAGSFLTGLGPDVRERGAVQSYLHGVIDVDRLEQRLDRLVRFAARHTLVMRLLTATRTVR